MKVLLRLLFVLAGVLILVTPDGQALEPLLWLITPEEAALPSDKAGRPGLAPEPTERHKRVDSERDDRVLPANGPLITIVKPQEGKILQSPVEVVVEFQGQEALVDPASLKVVLVKFIEIDITNRVRPFVSASGIRIPQPPLPAGFHKLKIHIADTVGRTSAKIVSVEII